MTDREQVISNLKKSIKYHGHLKDSFCKECIQSMNMAITMLEEQEETINDLGNTIRQLNQHIGDISEYMTPYGKVNDVKAYAESLKEKETVNPKKVKGFNPPLYVHFSYVCDGCGTDLLKDQPYCAGCGKPVK